MSEGEGRGRGKGRTTLDTGLIEGSGGIRRDDYYLMFKIGYFTALWLMALRIFLYYLAYHQLTIPYHREFEDS